MEFEKRTHCNLQDRKLPFLGNILLEMIIARFAACDVARNAISQRSGGKKNEKKERIIADTEISLFIRYLLFILIEFLLYNFSFLV